MHCHLNGEGKTRENFSSQQSTLHNQLYLHIGGLGICAYAPYLKHKNLVAYDIC